MYQVGKEQLYEAADSLMQSLQSKPYLFEFVNNCISEMSQRINDMNFALSGKEIARVNMRLGGFDIKHSDVVIELYRRFGSDIRHKELLAVANVVSQKAEIKIDRDAKRRKKVLFKWFSENWEVIHPILDFVVLEEPSKASDPESICDPFSELINVPTKKDDKYHSRLLLNQMTF